MTFSASNRDDALDETCARAGCALIGDEVFADYVAPDVHAASVLGASNALTFALGGLSKSCGLPHVKLGWIALAGPRALRDLARARLELISDTYLSCAGPVQRALPELFAIGAEIQRAIKARIAETRATLTGAIPVRPSDGGWTAIIPLPDGREDDTVAELLAAGVLVQPGWFYDLSGDHLVVSLLTRPSVIAAALPSLARVV